MPHPLPERHELPERLQRGGAPGAAERRARLPGALHPRVEARDHQALRFEAAGGVTPGRGRRAMRPTGGSRSPGRAPAPGRHEGRKGAGRNTSRNAGKIRHINIGISEFFRIFALSKDERAIRGREVPLFHR